MNKTLKEWLKIAGLLLLGAFFLLAISDLYTSSPETPKEVPVFRMQIMERQSFKGSMEGTILRDSETGTEVFVCQIGGVGVASVVLNKKEE